MPVNSTHPDYDKMLPRWTRCRAAIAGEDEVKAGREAFLPRPSGLSDDEYKAYVSRACYFNASGRTRDIYLGLIFRIPPVVEVPQAMVPWLSDINLAGESWKEFCALAVGEVLDVGRAGILIDQPRGVSEAQNLKQVEDQGLRPYPCLYFTEDILYWESTRVNGRVILSQVRLREIESYTDPADPWVKKTRNLVRVLKLENTLNPDQYVVKGEVYQEGLKTPTGGDKSGYALRDEYILKKSETEYLTEIPFLFLDPEAGTADVDAPPLLDLVNLNISHYRTSADLEHGRHWAGSPTPVFIGNFIDDQNSPDGSIEITIGSSKGIHLSTDGDAKFLEFTGQGLQALEKADEEKREKMSVLGVRLLGDQKSGVEAAETAQIYRSGESATLAGIANSVSKTLTKCLKIMASWYGLPEDSCVTQLNTDYMLTKITPQELLAQMQAVQAGKLPVSQFYNNLKAGGVVQHDMTLEQFRAELETESIL